jgi:hypothetical protein
MINKYNLVPIIYSILNVLRPHAFKTILNLNVLRPHSLGPQGLYNGPKCFKTTFPKPTILIQYLIIRSYYLYDI